MKLWMKGEDGFFWVGRTDAIDDHWLEWGFSNNTESVAWWTQGLEEVDTNYLFEGEG